MFSKSVQLSVLLLLAATPAIPPAAGQPLPGAPDPSAGVGELFVPVEVRFATFGGDRSVDVSQDIARICDGLKNCAFVVHPGFFPTMPTLEENPSGAARMLRVSFTCEQEGRFAEFPEGEMAYLEC